MKIKEIKNRLRQILCSHSFIVKSDNLHIQRQTINGTETVETEFAVDMDCELCGESQTVIKYKHKL